MAKDKPKAAGNLKAARILRDLTVDGVAYKAHQLVRFPGVRADALQADSSVDTHQNSVEYARSQGVKSIDHSPAPGYEVAPASEPAGASDADTGAGSGADTGAASGSSTDGAGADGTGADTGAGNNPAA